MEPERIELSAKERERLKVLHQVDQGHLKQVEAARRLRLTDRHVRRFQVLLQKQGDGRMVHRLRGRRSNRRLTEALTRRARQVLPAYGLQDSPSEKQNQKPKSKPNPSHLLIILGGNLASGHFYFALTAGIPLAVLIVNCRILWWKSNGSRRRIVLASLGADSSCSV
jgi:hypothetical protein